jgi:hypothetical protein
MSLIRAAAAALAMMMLVGGVAHTAAADPRGRDRDRGRHVVRHYRRPPPAAWGYGQPSYVQAPPPVVYGPPEMPPAINFSLNFR